VKYRLNRSQKLDPWRHAHALQRKKIWPFFAIALPYCLRSQSREPYWVGRILVAVREEKLIEPNPLIRELLARIRAILRRKVDGTASPVFSNGAVQLEPSTREATANNKTCRLTAREFALLQVLLTRPGTILSRDKLERWTVGRPRPRGLCRRARESRCRGRNAENILFRAGRLGTMTGVIAKRSHTRKCLRSTKWQQRARRSCHSWYRTEKRTNAVRVEFSTEQHRQTPSQQGGQTGGRLRARSGDFSYPDCRSSRRALASQRAGGFAPTQHPQTPTPERLRG